jgi:hypothetical protein
VLGVLRAHLASSPAGYTWLPGREAVDLSPHAVLDHTGAWHRGDLVILCPGAAHSGIADRTWPPGTARRCAGCGCR